MKKLLRYHLILAILILCSMTLSAQDGRAGEEINWQALSNGGSDCSSINYKIRGTLCQTATTSMSSTNYNVHSGYWQMLPTSAECQGMCGNVNGDGTVNVSDVVYIINYIFNSGPPPLPIVTCMDSNSDASVNLADAFYIINYVFIEGSPPPGDCSAGSGWIQGDCCEYVAP